jgi:hypothetical protein
MLIIFAQNGQKSVKKVNEKAIEKRPLKKAVDGCSEKRGRKPASSSTQFEVSSFNSKQATLFCQVCLTLSYSSLVDVTHCFVSTQLLHRFIFVANSNPYELRAIFGTFMPP